MRYLIHPDLDKVLTKLAKRDKSQFEAILKKIDEISNNPNHYKNLRVPLQKYKRVHIHSSFVLLFRIEKESILFRYYDHHDNIYKLNLK